MTVKAGSHLHPRYKQMKATRPFEGTASATSSGELSDQKRLLSSSWSVGQKLGKFTNSMVFPRDFGPRGRITFPP